MDIFEGLVNYLQEPEGERELGNSRNLFTYSRQRTVGKKHESINLKSIR